MIIGRLLRDRPDLWQFGSDELLREYTRFLSLAGTFGYAVVPSHIIDLVWHQHILDTARYGLDCNAVFDHLVEHYPYLGFDGLSTRSDLDRIYAHTLRLYESIFGAPPIELWGQADAEACGGGGNSLSPGRPQ